jgi:type VI secretion system secreted protein VgrG
MANFDETQADNELVQPCEDTDYKNPDFHWIEIELVYENAGEPVPGEEYCIEMPDGAKVRGMLNQKGWARVNFIKDPGNCKISFPGLDQDAWEPE